MIQNDNAEAVGPLADFCCGPCSTNPSAQEVNATAARLVHGGPQEQGGALAQHVIMLRDQRDTLLGISLVIPDGDRRLDSVPYLNGYGREKRFARYTLADQKTSLGEALIRAAVELVTPEGGDPPELQAFVREDNTQSHRPLTNLKFERGQNQRLEVHVELPEGVVQDEVDVEIPVFFQITLPSGKTSIVQQELWRRPAAVELAPLDPEVYTGPSQDAKEAAQA